MSYTPKKLTAAEYKALITGLPTYCPNLSIILAGQSYTTPQAVALLTTLFNSSTAVATAKGAWKEAIVADDVLNAQSGPIAKELRQIVKLMFSNTTNALAAFDIAPRKVPTPLTAAARTAAEAKAKATRVARGTTSKKQKAQITGNVTGVTITPVTIPATPAPAAAPPVGTAATTPPVTTAPTSTAANGSSVPHT
jgi:hypothetical protein